MLVLTGATCRVIIDYQGILFVEGKKVRELGTYFFLKYVLCKERAAHNYVTSS